MSYHQDLRVCVFTTSYPRFVGDDAGVFVQRLVTALSKLGVHMTVFVPRDSQESPHEVSDELEVHRYNYSWPTRGRLAFGSGIMPNLRREPFLILQAPGLLLGFFFAALKGKRFHVIHANWLLTAIPAFFYSLFTSTPYVVTARGEDVKLLRKGWARQLLRIPLHRCASITAVSNTVADEIRSLIPTTAHKLSVIPNGIEISVPSDDEVLRFRSERNLPKGTKYLLFVGSVIPRKRIEMLIEILRRVEDSTSVLLICGRLDASDYIDSIRTLARNHGLERRVRFEGAVPTHHVPALMSFANVYITASEHEGRPNSVLEAMACSMPVVASDISSHQELINHAHNGMLFSTPDMAADAVDALLRDGALAERLGEKAKASVEHFSWKRSAEAYRALFSSLRYAARASAESKADMH